MFKHENAKESIMKNECTDEKVSKRRSISLPVIKKDGIAESKTSRWRAAALIMLTLLMVVHFIQWRISGTTVSPIEPSEAMHTIQNGAVNAGFIFFVAAILATLIFGRFVCGWACHIVALQDLCGWMMKKIGIKPKPFRSRLLVYVPILVAFYMFVWPTVLRVLAAPKNESVIPQFTNHLITSEFWVTFPPLAVAIPFLFICGFMTVYFLGAKGFCTYACPYGGVFGLADKVAPGRIRVTDDCEQCGHCTAVCTSNVIVHAEVREYGMVVDPGCMKCMDCVSVCPNDALYFGFGKPAVNVPQKVSKNYSLTWAEEVFGAAVFALSYFAVWDVYQLVPMFMALGIAAVTTFLALRSLRLFTSENLSFYRHNLRSTGSVKKAGWVFLGLSALWIGLVIHSGWIHYNESAGSRAFANVQIPDELALAESDPKQWLNPTDRINIEKGIKHLAMAENTGLFVNSHALPKLAWLEYLSGNTEKGLDLLGEAAANQEGQAKALSLYYRGAILNRLGRYEEALTGLDQALIERPDLAQAKEEKGEALWLLGRKPDAISEWSEALKSNPALPLANNMLASASADIGRSDAAESYEKQADQYTPNDPYFHWMLGLRLQNLGMNDLAGKHFQKAITLNPTFALRMSSIKK